MSDYREVDDNDITGGSDNGGANAAGNSETGNIQNSGKAGNGKHDSDEYEKVCYICHRTESKAGKMISMPGNIYVCTDCMQRTLDTINGSGMSYDDMIKNMNISNMPNMNNLNGMMFGDFMDNYGTPDRQKVKKKKEKSEPDIDLKSIPTPHHIKEKLD